MTRLYRAGRTETVRALSSEAALFPGLLTGPADVHVDKVREPGLWRHGPLTPAPAPALPLTLLAYP